MRTKPLHTAQEIRDEVDRLLNKDSRIRIAVPLPVATERDQSKAGANWDMHFENSGGYQIEIGLVLLDVKMRWDLKG